MTAFDSGKPPKTPEPSFGVVIVANLALLLVAIVGAFIGYFVHDWDLRLPPVAPQGQLQLAEKAFQSGNNQVALELFTRIAEQNNPVAQYWLAHMSELGLGVPRDPARAIELYKKAAARDVVAAEVRLGEIYLRGDIALPDFTQAKAYLEKAAYHGDPRAATLLGQMYRIGLGTAADPKDAYVWSEVATLEGGTFARRERDASVAGLSVSDQQAALARAHEILKKIKEETGASRSAAAKCNPMNHSSRCRPAAPAG
jgi:TPR repeat protein